MGASIQANALISAGFRAELITHRLGVVPVSRYRKRPCSFFQHGSVPHGW